MREASISYRRGGSRLNLPALELTAKEMIEGLSAAVRGSLGRVRFHPEPAVEAIFATWAQRMSSDHAIEFGFLRDTGLAEIVAAYLEDFGPGAS
jgi:hypothetical protein